MTASRKLNPGRPLYRVGEIPDGLATVTMLRRLRRRPAEGQKPAATLFYHGNKHTDLYEITASTPLPALSPGRQAAWTAARTCARCAATRPDPLEFIDRGRRLCAGCVVTERSAAARPSWLRLRAAAVAWAGDVLDDPDTVLIAAYGLTDWGAPYHVHAITLDGQVLVDVVARRAYPSAEGALAGIDRVLGGIAADRLVPVLTSLVGRRLIHTVRSKLGHYGGHTTPLARLSELTRGPYSPGLTDPSIRQEREDDFHLRWTDWHNRTWYDHPHSSPTYGRSGLSSVPVDGSDAAALTTAMLAGLTRMAIDAHPGGPPACPWLPPTGRTPCGATPDPDSGLCPDHTPPEESDGGPA
ncbi:hypothetical protein KIF24_01995 [Micromonospora sp. Llam7]|uniref:hypothetical protein n=1 Tax=Micromonospora tarapacensis TaxID=2835305 RepID=UPI001C83B941|nr:hypothetical protein [Micromonospora tarapacensis]MBX7264946.1 hypothetical protein [Micromonospora tarapacensis]